MPDGSQSLGHRQEAVCAALRHGTGDDIRRGTAEDHCRAGQCCQPDGHVAGVVARRPVLLLVRPFVFFVDDDEAEIRLRREDGAPGADDDVEFALLYAVPFVQMLAGRQLAVQDCDAVRKTRAEPGDGLRREGYLRTSTIALLPRLRVSARA